MTVLSQAVIDERNSGEQGKIFVPKTIKIGGSVTTFDIMVAMGVASSFDAISQLASEMSEKFVETLNSLVMATADPVTIVHPQLVADNPDLFLDVDSIPQADGWSDTMLMTKKQWAEWKSENSETVEPKDLKKHLIMKHMKNQKASFAAWSEQLGEIADLKKKQKEKQWKAVFPKKTNWMK